MIAYAARYGNQQRSEIFEMTSSELKDMNEALYFWIEKENASRES